jgi:hypothetical protein
MINRFSDDWFEKKLGLFCGGGGGEADGPPGSGTGPNDTATTTGGNQGPGGGSDPNDNDGDGIPNSIDATPGKSAQESMDDAVSAAIDQAISDFGADDGVGRGDDDDSDKQDRQAYTDRFGNISTRNFNVDKNLGFVDTDIGRVYGTPDVLGRGVVEGNISPTNEQIDIFGDTAPSIAAPEVAPPSVASDVAVGRQQPIAPPPSIRGQVTPVDPQAIADVQARNAISGITGMGRPTTVGESVMSSVFGDLAETPEMPEVETITPDITVTYSQEDLDKAQAELDAAKAAAYSDKQFGFDTGLPESFNVFGVDIPTSVGVVEGMVDAVANPEASLANAIAEIGIKSVDGQSAEGTANYNPDGLEVVTTDTPVTQGGRTAAYDPNTNIVYDSDPFSGINPFGDEGVPQNIQDLYSKKNAIDDAERDRNDGDGGGVAAPMPTDQVSPECPEGFEYDPVTDSCVRTPRNLLGPATVDIAAPTLSQYTQMAAPRPAALGPSQLIAPRPIDPLTGRPFRDGGIVNTARFANGGFVNVKKFQRGGQVDQDEDNVVDADLFEKYGFDTKNYEKYINRGLKGLGEDRNFIYGNRRNTYMEYNPSKYNKDWIYSGGYTNQKSGMTIENADALRSLLRVMDEYNKNTGGAYGKDDRNIRLNFKSGTDYDLLVDGQNLGTFSGTGDGMRQAAGAMVNYLGENYKAPELSQTFQAKQQLRTLPTYEGQSAYRDLAQQTLRSIVGMSDAQDWMDINKDDQVNISDAVQLLKYGTGEQEVPDDIFMLTPQGQIAALQDKYSQLENTYNTLTTDYGDVTGSMRDLQEQLATQTQQTEALQNQLTGMEGYVDPSQFEGLVDPSQFEGLVDPSQFEGLVDPSQFEGYIDPDTYAKATGQIADLQTQLSGLEGYVDPETYGNLQQRLQKQFEDYQALNTTYGTTQEDLNRAANEISQLQSQLGDLTGQKQQAQQLAEQRRVQGLIQQYGQPTDYTQFAPPAQSFMPQAAQTSRPTQYAPPAGIAGLQQALTPTVLPALDMPQFAPQPALDIPLLELAQLDPLAPVPYAPPSLYDPFASPTQNFGS